MIKIAIELVKESASNCGAASLRLITFERDEKITALQGSSCWSVKSIYEYGAVGWDNMEMHFRDLVDLHAIASTHHDHIETVTIHDGTSIIFELNMGHGSIKSYIYSALKAVYVEWASKVDPSILTGVAA